MASTDAKPIPQKNVAYRVTFPIFDADGDLVTGATGLDSEVSKDGGTFADCTNEATEIATNSGMYFLDLTSTEMNADTVAIIVKTSSSGAKTTPIVMYPEEAGDIRVNATQLNGTSLTGRDIGASVLLSSGTGTGQLDFTSGVVKSSLVQILGTALTETAGQIAAAFKQFFDVASPTGTMKAITNVVTATNLTNAPTSGDFTATMKTSLNAATPASVTGAVGSVTGNVGGNVVGSVASVTAGVTVSTNNDKTGYGLSAAAVQAIWDALTSALTTVGSIGKLLVDNINATISSRLASASYTAPDNSSITAIKAKTDNLPSDPADASVVAGLIAAVETKVDTVDTVVDAIKVTTDKLDDTLEDDAGTYRFTENALEEAPSGGGGGATAAQIADAVWDEKVDDHLSDRSFGMKIGIHIPFVAPDFDYKRIKKIIDEAVSSQKLPEVDMEPISVALQGLYEEIRAIDIPEAEKADFSPVLSRINDVEKAVKAIKIPETNLSPIERHLDKQDKIIKPQVEEIRDTLEKMLGRIRQYFDGDMDAFKREVESIKEAFESIPYVVMEVRDKPKPTEPKESKEEKKKDSPNVLEEYLKLK